MKHFIIVFRVQLTLSHGKDTSFLASLTRLEAKSKWI